MSCPNFTAADFANWNTTTSCFRFAKRLIGKDAIKDVRVALIEAIGAERECVVQALPDNKYRIEFTSPSYKIGYDLNGLNFCGVNITPTLAYEQLKNVFVDRAPLHMPNEYISSSLSAYGHVVSVQDLCVRGFKAIRTRTCMVTMSILKPIPVVVKIVNFPCSVRHTGQPPYCLACNVFGHFARRCQQGKSQAPRKTPSKAGEPVQCSQPMDAFPSLPQPSSLPAASPVNVGAAPTCTSTEPPVDSTLVALPPTGIDTDSGAGTAVSPVFSVDGISSSQMKKLVVEISEFKEMLSVLDEFSCHRQVTVVQRRSTSREKTKRLQKPRSTAGAGCSKAD
jgi:hypothetical protein